MQYFECFILALTQIKRCNVALYGNSAKFRKIIPAKQARSRTEQNLLQLNFFRIFLRCSA